VSEKTARLELPISLLPIGGNIVDYQMRVIIRLAPPPQIRVIIRLAPPTQRQRWLLAAASTVFVVASAALVCTSIIFPPTAEDVAFTVPDLPAADLLVSEVRLVGAAAGRRIAGVLKNRSGQAYSDIQMTFSFIGPDGDNVGSAEARVDRLAGYQAARFGAPAAPPVTASAVEIVVQQIAAQPPLAGSR
jgi:hypothetical protein